MAKGKEKAELSLEERLDTALVPNWEQPYKVPANWCWTTLGTIASILNGFAFKSANYADNGIRIIRITNVQDGYVEDDAPVYYPIESRKAIEKFLLQEDDLLISLTGNVGRVALLPASFLPAALNQRVGCLRMVSESFIKKYLFFLLLRESFQKECVKSSKGSAQLNLSTEWLKVQPVPLAPLVEQLRIVDRIESLFAKLDEAKEKAQAVVDGFEERKAAILHKAFTGELTRTWSEQQGKPLDTWKTKRFNEVAEVKSNLVDPADYPDHPHIAPDNIEKKTGKLLDYHTIAEDAVKSGKHRFFAGQILYSKIRPNLSKVVVVDFDGLCSADMYPIEPKEGVNTRFLWYYMLSEDFVLQASTAGSRSVLPKINQKELSSLKVQITELEEQEKVVAVLDGLFEKEQRAKEAAEQVVEQIDGIKKSILARAFRGELGTNDPNDESAIELLKKVLQKEIPEPKQTRRITIPKDLAADLKTELEKKIVKLYFQKETSVLSINEIMGVSSKKFDVLESIRSLEQRQIISKQEDGNYKLMR